MSLKSRLEKDYEEIDSKQRTDKEAENSKEANRVSEYNRRVNQALSQAERYYKQFVLPALVEINEVMGGHGPNPDGSLPWNGGESWSQDPYKNISPYLNSYVSGSAVIAEVSAQVIWHKTQKQAWKSRDWYSEPTGSIRMAVNNQGIVSCTGGIGSDKPLLVDLTVGKPMEKLSDTAFEIIHQLNIGQKIVYKPGFSPIFVPENALRKIFDQVCTPIFRGLSQRYNVDLTQNPNVEKRGIFGRGYYSNTPQRPGFIDEGLTGSIILNIMSTNHDGDTTTTVVSGIRLNVWCRDLVRVNGMEVKISQLSTYVNNLISRNEERLTYEYTPEPPYDPGPP